MKDPLVVGLDLGTTRVKGAVFATDGRMVAESVCDYPTFYSRAGWVEQSPLDWQAAVKKSLRGALAALGRDGERIAALGLSCHAPSLVPVDADGAPVLDRVPIWQDERSAPQARRLVQEIGYDWVGLGMPYAAFAAKLKWFTETQPELARVTRFAFGTKAYLAHWLTGRHATDPSSEPCGGDEWSEVCRACGWKVEQLPSRMAPTDVIGPLRSELAEEIGLARPVPVVIGLNDGGSSVLGSGAVGAGDGVVTLGTNGVIFVVSDSPVAAERRLARAVFCWPYLEGAWITGGQTKTGGASLQWFLGVLQHEPAGPQDFEAILSEADDVPPGCQGAIFLPYLVGQGTPTDNPSATGAFAGLTMGTTRAHLARAVLEGVAFTLRDVLEELKRLKVATTRLNITGGGATSVLWRRIVSEVLDVPLGHSQGDSCLGAAILASVGVGLHSDIPSACAAMCPPTEMAYPSPEAVAVYQRVYRDYGALRETIAALPT
jgi:xylulokinase